MSNPAERGLPMRGTGSAERWHIVEIDMKFPELRVELTLDTITKVETDARNAGHIADAEHLHEQLEEYRKAVMQLDPTTATKDERVELLACENALNEEGRRVSDALTKV